ncbi:unnamed protein product [Agarophyton chilense]
MAMVGSRAQFFTFGLPFLTFMVAGHWALTFVTQGRYDVRDEKERQQELMTTERRVVIPEEALKLPPQPSSDYEMKPIPR